MRKHLPLSTAIALGTFAVLGLSACDPYYYQGSAGGSYSNYNSYPSGYTSGYGPGWGYGNPGFSTSLFVSTGSPIWGYDPYSRAYYNYSRRSYYDPYLYGYYPVGYRPPILVGVPHPRGYRNNYCPPPVRITNVTLRNYDQRAQRYGRLDHSWSRQVQKYDYQRSGSPGRGGYDRGGQSRPPSGYDRGGQGRPPSGYSDPRSRQATQPARSPSFGAGNRGQYSPQTAPQPRVQRDGRGAVLPNPYNVPVARDNSLGRAPEPTARRGSVTPPVRSQPSPNFQPQLPRQVQPRATPPQPASPRSAPQIERRMPDRTAREASRQVERPMPQRVERPAPVVSPPAPQPAPGPASDGGRPGRSRGREGN